MLKTLLTLSKNQLDMITNLINNKVKGKYRSSRSSRLVEKLAKSKNFKNPKFKNYWIYKRT